MTPQRRQRSPTRERVQAASRADAGGRTAGSQLLQRTAARFCRGGGDSARGDATRRWQLSLFINTQFANPTQGDSDGTDSQS